MIEIQWGLTTLYEQRAAIARWKSPLATGPHVDNSIGIPEVSGASPADGAARGR
jgi:hypothetical protein